MSPWLITVVFKLCAAALLGAVRNSKGAAKFFRQYEIFKDCLSKFG